MNNKKTNQPNPQEFVAIESLPFTDLPTDMSVEDLIMLTETDDIESLFNPDDTSINDTNILIDDPSTHIDSNTKQEKKKRKPQSEIDRELVTEFYNNQTHENFNKLWERFYYGVKSYAFRFMHNLEMANEMSCMTFTRAWEYKEMYDPKQANFSTWIYTICRNLCLAELYRIKKDNYVPQDISDLYDSDKLSNNIITVSDNTQYVLTQGELIANTPDDITKTIYNTSVMEIENLGGNYAKVLQMKFIEDMKIREIADELDMNESTVKNYLYKGKEMLNKIMKRKHKNLYDMYIDACASSEVV